MTAADAGHLGTSQHRTGSNGCWQRLGNGGSPSSAQCHRSTIFPFKALLLHQKQQRQQQPAGKREGEVIYSAVEAAAKSSCLSVARRQRGPSGERGSSSSSAGQQAQPPPAAALAAFAALTPAGVGGRPNGEGGREARLEGERAERSSSSRGQAVADAAHSRATTAVPFLLGFPATAAHSSSSSSSSYCSVAANAVAKLPSPSPSQPQLAIPVSSHPLAFFRDKFILLNLHK